MNNSEFLKEVGLNETAVKISRHYLFNTDSKTNEEALEHFKRDGHKFPSKLRRAVSEYIKKGIFNVEQYQSLKEREELGHLCDAIDEEYVLSLGDL